MSAGLAALDAAVAPAERDSLVARRRDFHRHPELGFAEVRTAGIVEARLRELGLDVRTGVGGTGVLGDRGTGRRTLLVRADMDALPVHEENDVPYRSAVDGVMHACGHDGHTAIALSLAERIAPLDLPGRVRLAFQPSEETGEGADRMIADGALDGVDAALGLHLWNWLPLGRIGVVPGPAMAAVDDVTIVVRGRGGHAALPHRADDPIVTAAEIVGRLQTIVSRTVDPLATAVVSVTAIHGGDSYNVIPPDVTMRGTVRSFDEDVRDLVHRRIREIVGERGTVVIEKKTRPLVNDPAICALVREAAAAVVGAGNVVSEGRSMGGEDFASVLAAVPGCFFFVGSAVEGSQAHHHPRFDVDERALPLGLAVLARTVRLWLEREAA